MNELQKNPAKTLKDYLGLLITVGGIAIAAINLLIINSLRPIAESISKLEINAQTLSEREQAHHVELKEDIQNIEQSIDKRLQRIENYIYGR